MKPVINNALLLVCFSFLFSCKKNTYVNPGGAGNGQVSVVFSEYAGANIFNLGQAYTTQHGDQVTINVFMYYVSNIKLTGSGVSYTEPNSYHLIDHNNPAGGTFTMTNMPYGQYTTITFTVGVDSTQDVLGPGTGVLAASNNMFISSTAGYMTMALQGTSPQSTQSGHLVAFHPNGFYGANSALKTVTLTLSTPISVTGDVTHISHVNVNADVLSIFNTPNVIDLSINSLITAPGADVTKIAENYAHMFSATGSM